MFINVALAQEVATQAAKQQPSMLTSFLPLIAFALVLYFLMIRPQQKKQKEHNDMIKAVAKGDEVVIAGGIYGKVAKIEEENNIVLLQVADSVQIKVKRDSITDVVTSKKAA